MDAPAGDVTFPPSSDALLSADRLYRYRLSRRWGPGKAVVFVGLNPSTADEHDDDHTITRCRAFARAWGFDAIEMVNLVAWRSTDPCALLTVADPVGPANDGHLIDVARAAGLVVAAWGDRKEVRHLMRPRAESVRARLNGNGVALHVLGSTKAGVPRHPSRLPGGLRPVRWERKLEP